MPAGFHSVFDPASPHAAAISQVFIIVLVICGVILAIVAAMVGVGLVRFRAQAGAGEPRPVFGNRKLEIFWTAGPLLIILWLFVLTARGMRSSDPPASREPDLTVISHQWWWEVRYEGSGVVTANEIHLPVGSNWLVRLESADVIHDFWAPALGPKMDVVPGQTNHVWLEADHAGEYGGTCAEYCGAQHAWMRFSVIAQTPAEFAAWLRQQENSAAPPATPAAQTGLKIFQAMTCVNCHSIRGVSVAGRAGPDLSHLSARKTLAAGVLANTETNLFHWLKNPGRFKPACLMPDLNLTDAQAGALAEYLEGLP